MGRVRRGARLRNLKNWKDGIYAYEKLGNAAQEKAKNLKAGENMLDRGIPFYNVILKCEDYRKTEIVLPAGYHLRNYRTGDEKAWANLEYEIGDFASVVEAEEYFISQYGHNTDALRDRCFFVTDAQEHVVGSCIAWKDNRGAELVASLHWLVVSPSHQGKKLGKVLCQRVMNVFQEKNEFPVYIHTQPWSYIAILLYVRQGFKLQMTDTFSHYENQYMPAMNTLKKILTVPQYDELVYNSVR